MKKYKVVPYGEFWALKKRFLLVFWLFVVHNKIVYTKKGSGVSREILLFKHKVYADIECRFLNNGMRKQVISREFANGKHICTRRAGGYVYRPKQRN